MCKVVKSTIMRKGTTANSRPTSTKSTNDKKSRGPIWGPPPYKDCHAVLDRWWCFTLHQAIHHSG